MHDPAMSDEITIEELRSLPEIAEWQAVAASIWSGDDSDIIQEGLLLTLQRYGGLLLGARDASGQMVGILLGFPGLKDGKPVHCSHMLGMVPEWRGKHLGFRMKCLQREFVLAQGLDLILWTVDPLETPNAHLNLGYLGGICYHYHPNLYGNMNDSLNCGMETDRLTVSWHIRHPLVEKRLAGKRTSPSAGALLDAGLPLLTNCDPVHGPDGAEQYVRLTGTCRGWDAPAMLVEVPSNMQTIKLLAIDDARAWRLGIRDVISDLFDRGYAIVDLVVDQQPGRLRRCYFLIDQLDSFLAGDPYSNAASLKETLHVDR
jgi:predicted GNAT superfamily acetyltransferase